MKAEIYTKDNCHFCVKAKDYLSQKNIEYIEISAVENIEKLIKRVIDSGNLRPKSAPQIFLDNEYVGGYDRLIERI